jgi:hypothetical protein
MRNLKTLFAALALTAAATSAGAEPTAMTATLATPLAKEKVLVADGAAWRCAESTCRVASQSSVNAASACRALVRQVGAITQIGTPDRPLVEARLAKCNGK